MFFWMASSTVRRRSMSPGSKQERSDSSGIPPNLPWSPISCLHRVVNSPFTTASPSGHTHRGTHSNAGSGPAFQQSTMEHSPQEVIHPTESVLTQVHPLTEKTNKPE